jgi:hypothetical protein
LQRKIEAKSETFLSIGEAEPSQRDTPQLAAGEVHSLSGYTQYSHPGIKAGTFHAQDLGWTARPGNPAARFLEHVANVPSLHFFQRGEVGEEVIWLPLYISGQVKLQLIFPSEQGRPFQDVFPFPEVAGPSVAAQGLVLVGGSVRSGSG